MNKNLIDSLYESIFQIHNQKKPKLIPFAGKIFNQEEIKLLLESFVDFWFTAVRFAQQFESEFSGFMQQKYCLLTNSGSSVNLLAFSPLTSHKLRERRLKPGDEVIAVAACFPTTVNPIVQNQMIPVFVDLNVETYNINVDAIDNASLSKELHTNYKLFLTSDNVPNFNNQRINLVEITNSFSKNTNTYICGNKSFNEYYKDNLIQFGYNNVNVQDW